MALTVDWILWVKFNFCRHKNKLIFPVRMVGRRSKFTKIVESLLFYLVGLEPVKKQNGSTTLQGTVEPVH